MKSYGEKLKDPRWQKRRLKILERDKWKCRECGGKEKTLHIHHQEYHKSGNPWDALMKDLETLCKDCHKIIKLLRMTKAEQLEHFLERANKLDIEQLEWLVGEFEKLSAQ